MSLIAGVVGISTLLGLNWVIMLIISFFALIISLLFIYYKPGFVFSLFIVMPIIIRITFDFVRLERGVFTFSTVIILLFIIFNCTKNKKDIYNVFTNPIMLGFILLSISLILGIIITPNPLVNISKLFSFYAGVLLYFLASSLCINKYDRIKDIYLGVLILGLIFFFVIFIYSDYATITIERQRYRLALGRYANLNSILIGRYAGLVIIVSLFYIVNFKKISMRVLSLVALFLASYGMIVSGSRAPLLFFIVAIIIYAILYSVYFKKTIINILIIIPPVIILLFIVFKDDIFLFQRLQLFFDSPLEDINVFQRLVYFKESMNLFVENPIFGSGTNAFRYMHGMYPHNLFFEIMAEHGLFGLISLLVIVYGNIVTSILLLRKSDYQVLPYSILTIVLWIYGFLNAQVTGDINSNHMFWVFSGMLLALLTLVNRSTHSFK